MSLTGVNIVELGGGIGSRFAGMLLQAAGARVLSLRPVHERDPDPELETYDAALAAWLDDGKTVVDVSTRIELDRHLEDADVVVDGLAPCDRRRLGVSPVPNRLTTPWVMITPYGKEFWDRPGSDLCAAALAAVVWPIGRPDREPLTIPHHLPSVQAGAIAALLAAAAVVGDSDSVLIDVSVAEVVASYAAINGSIFVWEREGHRAARSGGAYPYTILPCADGYACLAVRTNAEWRRTLEALGNPDWANDPKFQDVRVIAREHADEADAHLVATLAQFTRAELLDRAAAAGCSIAPVRDITDLVADKALRERGAIVERDVSGTGVSVAVPAVAWFRKGVEARPQPRREEHAARGDKWLPLSGFRLLDFGWVVSAPLVSMLLAALGADVIKIESATRVDNMRLRNALRPEGIDWTQANNAPTFHLLNRGKRSIAVNLKTDAGRVLVGDLIRTSDAVIENYTVGTFERLGFDNRTLSSLNPKLVRLAMPAVVRHGVMSRLRGYAATTGALAGLENSVGYASDPGPTGMLTFGIADYAAGAMGAFALVASLRRPSGYEHVDLSQVEANVVCLGAAFAAHAAGWTTRPGNRSYRDAPSGVFRANDGGFIAIEVASDEEWTRLAALLELDPSRYRTARDRRGAAEVLENRVAAWAAVRTRDAALDELGRAELRCAPVLTLPERRQNAVFVGRRTDVPLLMESGEAVLAPNAPWVVGERERWLPRAPNMGEHTHEVCRDLLAMESHAIRRLHERGVLETSRAAA